MKDLEKFILSITALEPCYGQTGGNATRIYTRQGKILEDSRTLNTILKNIARYFDADLCAKRKTYGKLLGCSQNIPIPFSPDLVLVPLKTRCPQFDQDGATGYVNLCAVNAVIPVENAVTGKEASCHLQLSCGSYLPSIFSPKNVEKKLINARHALIHFISLQGSRAENGSMPVMEKAGDRALDRLATISKLFYQLMTE